MPFTVKGNKKDGFRLYNTDKKEFAKRMFKTREAAENMRSAYMSRDKKKTVPKGSHRMADGSIMKDSEMKSTKKKKSKY